MSKEQVIKGTLILTMTGITCRFLGFLYKIWLSRALSPSSLGTYQLIFPIYGICHTIFASSIQTGISNISAGIEKTRHPLVALRIGLIFSLTLATTLSILVYTFASPISRYILMEPSCGKYLKILSISFPFCAIYSCINGYYYGIRKTFTPALSQLIEQSIRISLIFIIPLLSVNNGIITGEIAVLSLVIGEIAECLFSVISFIFTSIKHPVKCIKEHSSIYCLDIHKKIGLPMIKYCYPLLFSRLIISLLITFEAILIPVLLRAHGLKYTDSLTMYGILTGMALPFIFFPNAFSSSYNLLMLSEIASAKAENNTNKIIKSITISFSFAAKLGIISSCIFLVFGRDLGYQIFGNISAGYLISGLSIISVFMYISSIMSSVLNGLGFTKKTFINSITSMILRILLTACLIPPLGIGGYIISLFFSDAALCLMNIWTIKKHIGFNMDLHTSIIKPALTSITITMCFYYIYISYIKTYMTNMSSLYSIASLLFYCCLCVGTILFFSLRRRKYIINQ